jgi:hypothetical protein
VTTGLRSQSGVKKDYEVVGSVHTLSQRKQSRLSSSSLSHLRDFDSFDVGFSSEGLVLTETAYRYDGKVLDMTRFEFDAEKRVVRSITTDDKGVVLTTSDFQHELNRSKETRRDATELVSRIFTNEFDGERPLTLASFLGDGKPVTRKVFEYRERKLVSSVGEYWGVTGELSSRWISSYDEFERLKMTRGQKPDGTPLGDGKYKYEYDGDGRLSECSYLNEFTDEIASVETYTYIEDVRGNWIERMGVHQWSNNRHRTQNLMTRALTYWR